ncbi:hypothetical protein D3C85_1447200 [compost metagenome]
MIDDASYISHERIANGFIFIFIVIINAIIIGLYDCGKKEFYFVFEIYDVGVINDEAIGVAVFVKYPDVGFNDGILFSSVV